MNDGSRRNLTGVMAAVVTAGLALGGGMYLWTVRNGEQLTDRNLRELARMGREIEGRLANLHTVLGNLAKATDTTGVKDRALLVPYLSPAVLRPDSTGVSGTRLALSRGLDSMSLTYRGPLGTGDRPPSVEISARWPLAPLRPALLSEYFQMTLLADSSGEVVLSAPESTGIRVHNLSSLLDSVPPDGREAPGPASVGRTVTQIRRATIAGRPYRVFLQPLRVPLVAGAGSGDGGPATWMIAGLVPENRFRQERLALGPAVVLVLGLFLAIGLLSWPFVRAASMGPRERLGVRNLLALVASLILVSGGVGLGLADLAYYGGLRRATFEETGRLADTLEARLRLEIEAAVHQVNDWTDTLRLRIGPVPVDSLWPAARTRADSTRLRSILLKEGLPRDSFTAYPILTMAYWTDSSGRQVAKWTPRPANTSLVSVVNRDYYRAIRDGRGWALHPDSAESPPYFIESIRTWTTDEKSAAISTDVGWAPGAGVGEAGRAPWVGVALTNLASLERPVLPSGISFSVVDSAGRALFHERKERALEENLVDETGDDELLRATLAAHARRDLDVVYRGRRNRLYVRPLRGSPISLVVMLDMAHLATVHFETVFESATLFAAFCVLMLVWFTLVELVVPRKMHWVWPDPAHAGKYFALGIVLTVFVATLFLPTGFAGVFGTPLVCLLIPFQGLGLGLVALSLAQSYDLTMRRARYFGLALAVVSTLTVGAVLLKGAIVADGREAWMLLAVALASAVGFAVVRLEYLVDRGRPVSRRQALRRLEPAWKGLRAWLGRERRAVRAYVYSMVAGLLLVGALPGYLLYQLAFRDRIELLARDNEVTILEGLQARRLRQDSVIRSYRLHGFEDAFDSIPYDTFFGSLPFAICRFPRALCLSDPTAVDDAPSPLPGELDELVPYLSDASLHMRGLRDPQPDRTWAWDDSVPGPRLVAGQDTLLASLPGRQARATPWWWLGLVAGVGLLWWMVRWMSRRVFLIDLWAAPPQQLDEVFRDPTHERHLLVVCTRSTDRGALHPPPEGWEVIDLMDDAVDAGDTPRLARDETASVLCIDHADHRVREGTWGRALLAFLERLVYDPARATRVVLLTSQEPADLLDPEKRSSTTDRYAERWTRLLGQFSRVAVRDGAREALFKKELVEVMRGKKSPAARAAARRAISVLRRECRRPPLERIGRHILETLPADGMAKSDLVARIRWEADTYYEALWTVLGDQEKLVIAQLSSGAVVNPSLGGAVARLLGRGILERGPELRVMNESFESFVRDRAPESVIREWERAGYSSTWQLIRLPFVLGWIGLAMFLFWTQRDLLGNTITFLTTAGVGLAAIGRMVTLFSSGFTSSESKSSG